MFGNALNVLQQYQVVIQHGARMYWPYGTCGQCVACRTSDVDFETEVAKSMQDAGLACAVR